MHFDSQFTCILKGSVHCHSASGATTEMSRFGEDLVYMNAGILEGFQRWTRIDEGTSPSSTDNDDDWMRSEGRRSSSSTTADSGVRTEEGTASSSTENDDDEQDSNNGQDRGEHSFTEVSRELQERLNRAGASQQTINELITALTTAHLSNGTNPIDVNY